MQSFMMFYEICIKLSFVLLLNYQGPEVLITLNVTIVVSPNPEVNLNGSLLDSTGLDGLIITIYPGDNENEVVFQDRVNINTKCSDKYRFRQLIFLLNKSKKINLV